MPTFHEMMNTLSHRLIAGRVRKEADLWPLRDILFDKQTSILHALMALREHATTPDMQEAVKQAAYHLTEQMGMLEKDMQTIETYCRKEGIER